MVLLLSIVVTDCCVILPHGYTLFHDFMVIVLQPHMMVSGRLFNFHHGFRSFCCAVGTIKWHRGITIRNKKNWRWTCCRSQHLKRLKMMVTCNIYWFLLLLIVKLKCYCDIDCLVWRCPDSLYSNTEGNSPSTGYVDRLYDGGVGCTWSHSKEQEGLGKTKLCIITRRCSYWGLLTGVFPEPLPSGIWNFTVRMVIGARPHNAHGYAAPTGHKQKMNLEAIDCLRKEMVVPQEARLCMCVAGSILWEVDSRLDQLWKRQNLPGGCLVLASFCPGFIYHRGCSFCGASK